MINRQKNQFKRTSLKFTELEIDDLLSTGVESEGCDSVLKLTIVDEDIKKFTEL